MNLFIPCHGLLIFLSAKEGLQTSANDIFKKSHSKRKTYVRKNSLFRDFYDKKYLANGVHFRVRGQRIPYMLGKPQQDRIFQSKCHTLPIPFVPLDLRTSKVGTITYQKQQSDDNAKLEANAC